MNDINYAVETALKFYRENSLPIPTNVVEYTKSYPPGLSRQVLSTKYSVKASDFVKAMNPGYSKVLSAKDRAVAEADRLGYEILSDLNTLTNNRDKVFLKCKQCDHSHTTTITSLQGSKLGCPKCKSGNLAWKYRGEELAILCKDRLSSELVSSIPDNQSGYVTLKHICGTEYRTQLLGVVSPTSLLRATCPNCRPSDRRVIEDGITFGSRFEADCYLKLKHLNPEIHVKYSDYFNTNRRWICDFKVGTYWVEVSNFKVDYKDYFSNIEDKRALVETDGSYVFLFVTSIKELDELISLM